MPSWSSEHSSGRDDSSSAASDTFHNSGAPLNATSMMEERRRPRRPQHVFSVLRSSLTRNADRNNSQSPYADDAGHKNGRKYLSRKDSNGGSESVGSGSDIGGG